MIPKLNSPTPRVPLSVFFLCLSVCPFESLSDSLALCLCDETMLRLWSVTPSLINFLFDSSSGVCLNSFLFSAKNSLSVQGLNSPHWGICPVLHHYWEKNIQESEVKLIKMPYLKFLETYKIEMVHGFFFLCESKAEKSF